MCAAMRRVDVCVCRVLRRSSSSSPNYEKLFDVGGVDGGRSHASGATLGHMCLLVPSSCCRVGRMGLTHDSRRWGWCNESSTTRKSTRVPKCGYSGVLAIFLK